MALYPCTACHERKPGEKLANVTIAWWTNAQRRVAWRLKLCVACYSVNILPLDSAGAADVLRCPACHTDVGEDLDPTYCTAFLPDVGRQQLEWATDGACAATIRSWAQEHGLKLEDQSGGLESGPQTDASQASDWAKLGLYPRE